MRVSFNICAVVDSAKMLDVAFHGSLGMAATGDMTGCCRINSRLFDGLGRGYERVLWEFAVELDVGEVDLHGASYAAGDQAVWPRVHVDQLVVFKVDGFDDVLLVIHEFEASHGERGLVHEILDGLTIFGERFGEREPG